MRPLLQHTDILILGGGFAGLSCFRSIDRGRREVVCLTNRNHFLFSPLLPLAATGAVEVRSIVEPLRSFQKKEGEVIVGKAFDIDPDARKVFARFGEANEREISFQTLVVAIGAVPATYGIPGVERHCLFFKEMKEARALREKILFQFERAAHLEGEARNKALRFLVVGAGTTGVELACEIHDLISDDLKKEFPALAPQAEIQIIEAQREILLAFDRTLANYAKRRLEQKRIRVRTELPVKAVELDNLVLQSGETVEAGTMIWTAGIAPNPLLARIAERLGVGLDRGRLPVIRMLNVADHPEIYAIGDCASFKDDKGRSLPATAQVAMKQGTFLGRQLSKGGHAPFDFQTMGMLASLGTGSAIADLGTVRFTGVLAFLFWRAAYLTRLVSLRNKVTVAFDWLKVRLFGRNTARIEFQVVGAIEPAASEPPRTSAVPHENSRSV